MKMRKNTIIEKLQAIEGNTPPIAPSLAPVDESVEERAEKDFLDEVREGMEEKVSYGAIVDHEIKEHYDEGKLFWFKKGARFGYNECLKEHVRVDDVVKQYVPLSDVKKILGMPTKLEAHVYADMPKDKQEYYIEEFQWLVLPHVGWVKTDKETANKWNINPDFSKRETRTIYKLKYL